MLKNITNLEFYFHQNYFKGKEKQYESDNKKQQKRFFAKGSAFEKKVKRNYLLRKKYH